MLYYICTDRNDIFDILSANLPITENTVYITEVVWGAGNSACPHMNRFCYCLVTHSPGKQIVSPSITSTCLCKNYLFHCQMNCVGMNTLVIKPSLIRLILMNVIFLIQEKTSLFRDSHMLIILMKHNYVVILCFEKINCSYWFGAEILVEGLILSSCIWTFLLLSESFRSVQLRQRYHRNKVTVSI